jgi:hypothetical protein
MKSLFALIAVFGFSLTAHAQNTYIVDQSGGGTHLTIASAVVTAVNGDTIKVVAGTYSEAVVIAEKLIIIAQPGTEIVSGSDAFALNTGSGGTVISGFTIYGRVIMNAYPSTEANRVIFMNNTVYDNYFQVGGVVVLANNTIYRKGFNSGIYLASPGVAGNEAVIFNNTLRGCILNIQAGLVNIVANKIDSVGGTAIYLPYVNSGVNYGSLKIVGNIIDSCLTGMSFANSNVSAVGRIIANNVITNCPTAFTFSASGQDWQGTLHNNIIYNATTASYSGSTPSASSLSFFSNVSMNCGGNASVTNSAWMYNCFFSAGNLPTGTGNINSNPLFVDASAGDFNLQGGSPGINTGHPAFIYTDIDKTRNNMGAYGGTYTLTNFAGGANAKVVDLMLAPASVVQGNNITVTAKGSSQ